MSRGTPFKKTRLFLSFTAILLSLFIRGYSEELPIPSYSNSVIVSLNYSLWNDDYFSEIDYMRSNFNFGLYAWLSISQPALVPTLAWHSDWNNPSVGIQSFKDQADLIIERAKQENVRLHIILCSGLARGVWIYREAKAEDVRNCQWYNENNIASDYQILDSEVLSKYVFGTLSRYARKMRTNLEAKAKAALSFLKEKMDENPDVLTALSGWGEAELNYHRIDSSKSIQDYFCDYSPFAVLEFRDWICHTGMYDNSSGRYGGEGYPDGGAKYQGLSGLAQFNQDFYTNFSSWDLKYFNWSLLDDFDQYPEDYVNPDPNIIPYSGYSHGNMLPVSGPDYIVGGFDPPRIMDPGNKFWDLWNLFRESMVHNFVKDMARWVFEAGIPQDRWYSHQVPADYLFGTNPSMTNKNPRYYSSASPLWTADVLPYGSVGATIYDIKFPTHFARTTKYILPDISAMSSNWAAMEYDAESYPSGFTVTPSTPQFILDQYLKIYDFNIHLINFYSWDGDDSHRIKGTNKEIALEDFVQKIRDKARKDISIVYEPPEVIDFSGVYLSGSGTASLNLSGKIWEGHLWEWKDWGDFSHFEIYRSNEMDFRPMPGDLLSTTNEYVFEDTSVFPGNVYFYKMRAVNSDDEYGPFSDEVMIITSSASAPVLYTDKKTLSFGAEIGKGSTSSQQALIMNLDTLGSVLNWNAIPSISWIVVSPASGSGNGLINIAVDHTGLSSGQYHGHVRIEDPLAINSPQFIEVLLTVYRAGGDSPPFGHFDTPRDGSTVMGSIAVTGWALDDIEATRIEIKRDPIAGDPPGAIGMDGKIYIGDAIFVKGARTDVEAAYPDYPKSDRAGWGYMMLTYGLPNKGNGTFTLYAFAYDSSGHRVLLGQKKIFSDNNNNVKPFGAIDTPGQGGTASGSNYVNWGWALTPPPKEIPRDGSTIWVFIDGVPVGHPNYNMPRQIIADLFPGYVNSDGPLGNYTIDTTQYENGTHTIAWSATDDAGKTDGIGSRFFEIQNIGGMTAKQMAVRSELYQEDYSGRLRIEVGGVREIEIEELERIELQLRGEGGSEYIGWGEDRSKRLPIGSTLDRERGIFYWIPGPGFLGKHVLHFAVSDGMFMSKPIKITVNIVPRRYLKNGRSPEISTLRIRNNQAGRKR